jgi:hypothetical protein
MCFKQKSEYTCGHISRFWKLTKCNHATVNRTLCAVVFRLPVNKVSNTCLRCHQAAIIGQFN